MIQNLSLPCSFCGCPAACPPSCPALSTAARCPLGLSSSLALPRVPAQLSGTAPGFLLLSHSLGVFQFLQCSQHSSGAEPQGQHSSCQPRGQGSARQCPGLPCQPRVPSVGFLTPQRFQFPSQPSPTAQELPAQELPPLSCTAHFVWSSLSAKGLKLMLNPKIPQWKSFLFQSSVCISDQRQREAPCSPAQAFLSGFPLL